MIGKKYLHTSSGIMGCLLLATVTLAQDAGGPPERSEVAAQYKWNLTDMYPSEQLWDEDYQKIEGRIKQFAALKGTTGQSPEQLLKVLEMHDQLNVHLDKLNAYASQKFDQDMRQPKQQALRDRARTLVAKYREALAWLDPELTSLPKDRLDAWLRTDELAIYRHYFDNLLRMRQHILSPREEELLAMASKATGSSANTFGLLTNTELKYRTIKDAEGNEITVTVPVYYDLIYSKDRQVRRGVYLALHQSYLDVKNALASTLEGAAQHDWFYAKARGYESSLDAALDQENLPTVGVHESDRYGEQEPAALASLHRAAQADLETGRSPPLRSLRQSCGRARAEVHVRGGGGADCEEPGADGSRLRRGLEAGVQFRLDRRV